jgi:hypothetical protein
VTLSVQFVDIPAVVEVVEEEREGSGIWNYLAVTGDGWYLAWNVSTRRWERGAKVLITGHGTCEVAQQPDRGIHVCNIEYFAKEK